MNRGEKRIRRGRPASGGTKRLFAPVIHDRSCFINPRGFTLIELLVVISLIALLLAVLLPSIQRVRKQAKAVACQSNLREWGVVFSMYMNENNEQLNWDTDAFWWRWSRGYSGRSNDVLLCPAARKYEVNTTDPHWKENASVGCGFGNTFSPWMATDDSMGGTFYGSYGFNSKGCTVGYTPGVTVSVRGATASSHLYRVGRSRTPVLLDAPWWWATGGGPPPTHGGDSDMTEGVSFCMNRHDEATNSLFLDWSVRRVGLKELWTLRWWSTFDVAGPWTKAGGVQPKDWPEWMRGFREY